MERSHRHADLHLRPGTGKVRNTLTAYMRGFCTSGLRSGPLVVLLIGLCLSSLIWAQAGEELALPEIGGPASGALSPEQEHQLGKSLIREVRRSFPLNEDPELNSYISALGLRLVSNNPDGHPYFSFILVNDGQINAFALPGGIVGINTGLFAEAENEAELASVMSHEIAHVTQRHLARMYANANKMSFATGLAILAAILASAYDSQLGEAALMTTLAASAQQQINFTRSNEEEADRIGIKTLAGAGYDPHAMPSFFDKMQRLSHTSPDAIPEYLSTHPVTTSRITDSTLRADQYPGPFRSDSLDFQLAKARLIALQTSPRTLIALYEKAKASKRNPADTYAYALALVRAGRSAQAIERLRELINKNKDVLAYHLALAWALREDNQLGESRDHLHMLNRLYPRHEPIIVSMAETELAAHRPLEALSLIDEFINSAPASPALFRLKAQAASEARLEGVSHEALADYHFAYGQYTTALQHIQIALKAPGLDEIGEARLRNKLDVLMSARNNAQN